MAKNSFIDDLFRVVFSKGLIIIIGITSSILTARYLGPENSGYVAALNVYPSIFMTFGALGVRQSVTYFLGQNIYPESKLKIAITQIWSFASIISVIVCFILMRYYSNSGENLLWVVLSLLPIPFTLFNTYNSGIFLGKNQIAAFNRVNWIPPLVALGFAVLFLIGFSWGVSSFLVASFIGTLTMSIIMLFKNQFIQSFSLFFEWSLIKNLLSLGLIYALSLLVVNLNYKIDVIILDQLSTPYEIGIYSKGANIIQYLWNIPMMLSTIVFARSASAKDGLAFSRKTAQLLRLSFLIIGIAAATMVFFSKYIIIGMYGIAFSDSVQVLQILAPGVVILTIFKVMNMDLAGKGKPWVAMKAMIPSLIINVVLNYILIPKLGAAGAAWASTTSYTIAASLFLYFYSKAAGITIKEVVSFHWSDFKPIVALLLKKKTSK